MRLQISYWSKSTPTGAGLDVNVPNPPVVPRVGEWVMWDGVEYVVKAVLYEYQGEGAGAVCIAIVQLALA